MTTPQTTKQQFIEKTMKEFFEAKHITYKDIHKFIQSKLSECWDMVVKETNDSVIRTIDYLEAKRKEKV